MIQLLVGPINSGKTTALKQHYLDHGEGDGFIAKKIMDGTTVTAYKAIWLSDGASETLILRDTLVTDEPVREHIGPYCVLLSGYQWLEMKIYLAVALGRVPIYLDDIGPLELSGGGFSQVLTELVRLEIPLVMTVRGQLVQEITDHFGLKGVQICMITGS